MFDKNCDRTISSDELVNALSIVSGAMTKDEAAEVIRVADKDNNGVIDYQGILILFCILLTHLFSMHPFSTSWKNQKTLRFSDIFRD